MENKSFGKLRSHLRKNSQFSECFCKDCQEKPILSHSIQNNRILNNISDDGLVYKLDIEHSPKSSVIDLVEVGRGKASTFKGFCEVHDNDIFIPIEEFDYVENNKEQEYLFAYRALAKEYYAKKFSSKTAKYILSLSNEEFKKICKHFGLNIINKSSLDEFFKAHLEGTEDNLRLLENYKIRMNINLEEQRYYKLKSKVLIFPNYYKLAASSFFFIEYDQNGCQINDFNDMKNMKPTFFTVFPQNDSTFVIISYFKNQSNYFDFLENQIINREIEEQQIIISNLISIYCENIFFNPESWDNLSEQIKESFKKLFIDNLGIRYKGLIADENLNIFNIH